MRYINFKNNFSTNVITPFIDDKPSDARIGLANIYNNGTQNPRATMYSLISAFKETGDEFTKKTKELETEGNYKDANKLLKKIFQLRNEIFAPSHPLVVKAMANMTESYGKMYPNIQTQKFTKYVLFKQNIPMIEKMKWIAKFL